MPNFTIVDDECPLFKKRKHHFLGLLLASISLAKVEGGRGASVFEVLTVALPDVKLLKAAKYDCAEPLKNKIDMLVINESVILLMLPTSRLAVK